VHSLTFKTYTGAALPSLKTLNTYYIGDTLIQFDTGKTYANGDAGGNITVNNYGNDAGSFTGNFWFNYEEMGELLNFAKVQRAYNFVMPVIPGVSFPFGILSVGEGDLVKLKSISKLTQISPVLWKATLEFVQDY
jgi:hypothetical protein